MDEREKHAWPPAQPLDAADGYARLLLIGGPDGAVMVYLYNATALTAMNLATKAPDAVWQRADAEMGAVARLLNPPPGEPAQERGGQASTTPG